MTEQSALEALTDKQVYVRLQIAIGDVGSQKAFALNAGISESFLSDVIHQRRNFGPDILSELGLKTSVIYVPLKAALTAAPAPGLTPKEKYEYGEAVSAAVHAPATEPVCGCGHKRAVHWAGTGSCCESTVPGKVVICPCGEFQPAESQGE